MLIAVDGIPGAGKGTLTRALAEHYGYALLDTGTLYRSVGYLALQKKADLNNAATMAKIAATMDYRFEKDASSGWAVILEGENVSQEIRQPEVSAAASKIAQYIEVRDALVNFQRTYGAKYRKTGIIFDGNDTGTFICPDAEVKIFLTANIEAIAHRRHQDWVRAGEAITFKDTLAIMKKRIERDTTRASRPAVPAKDAIVLDTTHMNAVEVQHAARVLVDKALTV